MVNLGDAWIMSARFLLRLFDLKIYEYEDIYYLENLGNMAVLHVVVVGTYSAYFG